MSRLQVIALVAFAVLLVGCETLLPITPSPNGGAVACTLIGCDSQVIFELDTDIESGVTYDFTACVDGACEEARVEVPPVNDGAVPAGQTDNIVISPDADVVAYVLHGNDFSGSHIVSLSLDAPGLPSVRVDESVEFERSQPNGPRCEPVCWTATIRM
jgi:hypothetical protein